METDEREAEERELGRILVEAAEVWEEPRQVSPELWKEMLNGQFLGLASSISCFQMSEPITPEIIEHERRVNLERERGLRDGLAGIRKSWDNDYDIGYALGAYCRETGDELSRPENIGLY